MTEQQWATETDPVVMLSFLRDSGIQSDRKTCLFAVAACRRLWPLLEDETLRRGVDLAERCADIVVKSEEWDAADEAVNDAANRANDAWRDQIDNHRREVVAGAALVVWYACFIPHHGGLYDRDEAIEGALSILAVKALEGAAVADAERAELAAILRDLFGPLPFRPVSRDQAWLTWNDGAVVKLATAIYSERTFEQLPILGDALQEAGCSDQEILRHCRGPQSHLKGCWVLDLLLGRS